LGGVPECFRRLELHVGLGVADGGHPRTLVEDLLDVLGRGDRVDEEVGQVEPVLAEVARDASLSASDSSS